jgi:hypothetical protein
LFDASFSVGFLPAAQRKVQLTRNDGTMVQFK